ncbi:MAG: cytochrome P450 [Anaerolineae bacterium]|nr:cytochrome P450 [Anaerolineae bacterium]
MTNTYPIWETPTRGKAQAMYGQMRLESPVHRAIGPISQNPFWFLTRYEDVSTFLKDPRFGKEIHKSLPEDLANRYFPPPDPSDIFAMVNYHLLEMDPPNHTRLRSLVHKAFTPKMVENLRPRIAEIAENLMDGMSNQQTGEGDLIQIFAFPLPVIVIAEMLGVPSTDRDKFREWTKNLLFGDSQETAMVSAMEFTGYINEMMEERKAHPQDDLLTSLIQAEESGDKMNHMELTSMIFLLLVAGHETTVNLIGNGTLAFLRHPDQLAKLRANPALIKNAIEEILRYDGPVETTTTRWAFEDVTFGDVTIPKGEAVLGSLLGANRDPAVFDNPDVFDIERPNASKHIAFGAGIHYCLGAPLARLEGTIALDMLLNRFTNLELAVHPDELEWNPTILLHGMKALPVRW